MEGHLSSTFTITIIHWITFFYFNLVHFNWTSWFTGHQYLWRHHLTFRQGEWVQKNQQKIVHDSMFGVLNFVCCWSRVLFTLLFESILLLIMVRLICWRQFIDGHIKLKTRGAEEEWETGVEKKKMTKGKRRDCLWTYRRMQKVSSGFFGKGVHLHPSWQLGTGIADLDDQIRPSCTRHQHTMTELSASVDSLEKSVSGVLGLSNCQNSPSDPQAGCAKLLYQPSYLCAS